jgi:hypothetical protein
MFLVEVVRERVAVTLKARTENAGFWYADGIREEVNQQLGKVPVGSSMAYKDVAHQMLTMCSVAISDDRIGLLARGGAGMSTVGGYFC